MKINGIACWTYLDRYPFLSCKTPGRMENIREGEEAAVIWGGKVVERESEEFSLLSFKCYFGSTQSVPVDMEVCMCFLWLSIRVVCIRKV